MPFTFSHPAITLPFAYLPKKWISITGLFVGSVTPDFEYFIRMKVKSTYSHTLEGLFWFDIPLAFLIAFIFHNTIRKEFYSNLPKIVNSRLSRFNNFNWNSYCIKNWFVVIFSILIGASSHIFWDSFTHHNGFFVQKIPILSESFSLFNTQIPLFKLFQHLSTLIGALAIVLAFYKLPRANKNIKSDNFSYYWLIVLGISFLIIFVRFLSGLKTNQYGDVIVTIISAVILSLILTPYMLKTTEVKR